jgi:predicted site-specific integrase-resolvase
MKNNKLYTQKEVAEIMGVTIYAVIKWVQSGKLNVVYLPTSGRPLITQDELDRIQTPINERP